MGKIFVFAIFGRPWRHSLYRMATCVLAPALRAVGAAPGATRRTRRASWVSQHAPKQGRVASRVCLARRVASRKVFVIRSDAANEKTEVSASVSTDEFGSFETDTRLGAVFPIISASAVFMAAWVFGPFPGSAYTGIQSHDLWLTGIYEYFRFDEIFGPTSLITKYAEAGRVPALAHAVPGAIWCLLAPLQLHPKSRSIWNGALHRNGGTAMLTAAAFLMAGYAVIDVNNLFADTHDFGGNVGTVSSVIDGFIATKTATTLGENWTPTPCNVVGVRGIAVWFIGTGVATGIAAKKKQFNSHRRWAVRHVGAGLWVACQRPVYSAIRAGAAGLGGTGLVGHETAFGDLYVSRVSQIQAHCLPIVHSALFAHTSPNTRLTLFVNNHRAFADAFYVASYVTTLAFFGFAEFVARGTWANETREESDVRDE